MSKNSSLKASSKQSSRQTEPKYCNQCGQKTFRPHRSVRELLWEFVENWFGFDSKAYKTARALLKPAGLTRDYFRNSHHNNHFVTPIKLYIFLSIIFFLLTQFGGLNLTEIEINLNPTDEVKQDIQEAVAKNPLIEDDVKDAIEQVPTDQADDSIENNISADSTIFTVEGGCEDSSKIFELWPNWLDNYYDKKAATICEAYDNIQYLPEDKQPQAKAHFGLSLAQNIITVLPQTFLFSMPILALALQILYFRSRRLYVQHLVLLIHTHCYMFAMILLYLGWYQLVKMVPFLENLHLGLILLLWIAIYLFMSMKRFYQQNFWWTALKYVVFSGVYLTIFGFIMMFALMAAVLSS